MKEKRLVPRRRFKEFQNTDIWEQYKILDIADLMDGDRGSNYPSGDDFSNQGHTLFLSAANVTKNGFSFESEQYITEEKSNALGNGKLELNDIVLTSRGSIGHVAWYNNDMKSLVPFARINSGMLILRSKEDVEPGYITQYLKSPLGKRQIDLISFGSAQPQLTKKDVSNYKISIPEKKEQEKLGEFFNDLDHLITLHHRKLEKTKALKSAYLAEMFPAEGERVPKRRFVEFTECWEELKVGDLGNIVTGSTPNTLDSTNYGGTYLFVSPADIKENRYVEKTITKLSEKGFKSGRILRSGSILFVSIGSTIGKVAQIKELAVTNQQINSIEPIEKYNDDFIYVVIKHKADAIKSLASTQAVPIVNKTSFSDVNIMIPSCLKEQVKIGEFFKKLDDVITNQQQKLNKLKAMKQAYLEEMFV